MLFEDLVIFANDQDGPSSIVALDKRTGRTVWSTLRSSRPTSASYGTPMIYREPGKRPQLICASGPLGLTSLDPYTGRQNWATGELPQRTVGSPVLADGLLIQTCGGGGKGKLLIAVDPRASASRAKTRIPYERKTLLPYVPTPIAYQGHVYLWNDDGVVSCMEAKTGRNVWTKRIGGGYSGSPVCIDGKIYIMSEKGEVVVIAASPTFKLLGRTSLEDGSHATPAVAHGRLYLRTFRHLICLEAQK
jgi:outer membrane protein assembly factor BamB